MDVRALITICVVCGVVVWAHIKFVVRPRRSILSQRVTLVGFFVFAAVGATIMALRWFKFTNVHADSPIHRSAEVIGGATYFGMAWSALVIQIWVLALLVRLVMGTPLREIAKEITEGRGRTLRKSGDSERPS